MAKEQFASREEIAEILGCDVRTITKYVKQNPKDFPSRVRGKTRDFPIRRCVTWKMDRAVAEAIASFAPPPPSGLLDAEKRKAIADAEYAELRVQKIRREVVPVADQIREMERAYARVRGRLLAVPGEHASRFLNLDSVPKSVVQLREMVANVLSELQQAGQLEEDEVATDAAESGGDAE